MKILKKILIAVLIAAVVLAGGAGFVYFRYLREPLELAEILSSFAQEEEMSLHVIVESEPAEGDGFTIEGDIQRTQQGDLDVFAVTNDLLDFCFCDGRIYLSSGKIWNLTETASDASDADNFSVSKIVYVLLKKASFRSEKTEEGKCYTISCEGDNLEQILQGMSADPEDLTGQLQSILVNIRTADQTVSAMDITASGTSGTYHVSVERSDCSIPIDPGTLEKMQAGTDGDYLFSADNLRLVTSVIHLLNQPSMTMDIDIDADFSGLTMNNSMKYCRTEQDGLTVSVLKAGGISFYTANGKTVTASGTALTEDQQSSVEISILPKLVLELVLNGDLNCEGTDPSYSYQMTLSYEGMKEVVNLILPSDYTDLLTLNQGAVTIGIDEEAVTGIGISIDGSVNLLITKVSGSVGVQMTVSDETAEIPEAAINALK